MDFNFLYHNGVIRSTGDVCIAVVHKNHKTVVDSKGETRNCSTFCIPVVTACFKCLMRVIGCLSGNQNIENLSHFVIPMQHIFLSHRNIFLLVRSLSCHMTQNGNCWVHL